MAGNEPGANYVLTPSAGSPIAFNAGDLFDGTDLYWLADVQGLDSADIRNPRFKKPVTDGARVLRRYEDGLLPVFLGMYLIQSVPENQCQPVRNEMQHALLTCLRACEQTAGTLSWHEEGVGDCTLAVFYDVRLTHQYESDYRVETFSFGLASEANEITVTP